MNRLIIGLTLMMVTMTTQAGNEESPKYRVLEKQGKMEIRHYDSYFVAQTEHDGSSGDGFRKLFAYISGKNTKSQEIPMTAPVTNQNSVQIDMTAPVMTVDQGEKKVMSFMIPSKFSKNQIPKPLDPTVKIVEVPERKMAIHQYSWLASDSRNKQKALELKKWLESEGRYSIVEGPIYAGYDSPYTLPNLKTHEIMFVIE